LLTRRALLTILALSAASHIDGREPSGQAAPPCEPPPPPASITAAVDGRVLTLTWTSAASPTNYSVEFGDAPGSTYLGTTDTGIGRTSFIKTLDPGVYYVRVRAANGCGVSTPSNEITVTIDPAHIGARTPPDVVVVRRTATRNTYFPTAEMLKDGDIVVVYYDSPDHVSPNGRISSVRSRDQGRTWSTPAVVVDTPIDDRDPSIVETARGTLLISYFASDVAKAPASQGVFVVRSIDRGKTWSAPIRVATTLAGPGTSAKILQLEGGDLLIPVYGGPAGSPDAAAAILRSTDDGVTWPAESEVILAASSGVSFVEPALGSIGNGRLIAMIRTEGHDRAAYEAASTDGGRTWSRPEKTTLVAQASDLLPIDEGRNRYLVHTYGDLSGRFGDSRPTVLEVIRFREFPRARWTSEPRLLHQGHCWTDEGYPSSVRLRDGRILTVYYDACAGYIGGSFSTVADPAAAADCTDPPGRVELKLVSLANGAATLEWTSSSAPHATYMLEAGTIAGAADALAIDVGRATSYRADQVKAGTYHVRVRATNACGSSPPSNEVTVVVP
jgi:hypothetical protein